MTKYENRYLEKAGVCKAWNMVSITTMLFWRMCNDNSSSQNSDQNLMFSSVIYFLFYFIFLLRTFLLISLYKQSNCTSNSLTLELLEVPNTLCKLFHSNKNQFYFYSGSMPKNTRKSAVIFVFVSILWVILLNRFFFFFCFV